MLKFFFSSRRRHTICLIDWSSDVCSSDLGRPADRRPPRRVTMEPETPKYDFANAEAREFPPMVILENTTVCNLRCIHCPQGQGYPDHPRSEERRVGKECVTRGRREQEDRQ